MFLLMCNSDYVNCNVIMQNIQLWMNKFLFYNIFLKAYVD